jgi:hypothetical protein
MPEGVLRGHPKLQTFEAVEPPRSGERRNGPGRSPIPLPRFSR